MAPHRLHALVFVFDELLSLSASNDAVPGVSLIFVCDELLSPSDFSAGLPLPFCCVSASVPPVSLTLASTPPCYFTYSIYHLQDLHTIIIKKLLTRNDGSCTEETQMWSAI